MSTFCPLYKNKEVFDGFNNMIESLGGTAMTEEEFKSRELRNQRTGFDLQAMEAAYMLYDRNNGNFLDKAPNGKESILWNDLLLYNNNNVSLTIRQKSDFYSESFKNKYGDWFNGDTELSLDINGEPLLSNFDGSDKKINKPVSNIINSDIDTSLKEGNTVSSSVFINNALENSTRISTNSTLLNILSLHDIPVKYDNSLGYSKLAVASIDENGKAVIKLNPNLVHRVNDDFLTQVLTHELVHVMTSSAFLKARNQTERDLIRNTNKLHKVFDKLFRDGLYVRTDDLYGLTNPIEFVAEFVTNKQFRELLYKEAQSLDNSGRFNNIIKNFVNKIWSFLTNKPVFKTNTQKLDQYQKQFEDFIYNKNKISNGQAIEDINLLKEIKKYNDGQLSTQFKIKTLEHMSRTLEQLNNMPFIKITRLIKEDDYNYPNNILTKLSNNIAQFLTLRLKALTASNLPEKFKVKHKQILEQQIEMFNSGTQSLYQFICYLLTQIKPQLMEDCEKIKEKLDNNIVIDYDSYMYQMHDNFGTYNRILDEIDTLLSSKSIRELLAKQVSNKAEDFDKSVQAILDLKQAVKLCNSVADDGIKCLKEMLLLNTKRELINVGNETHDPTMADYLTELIEKNGDISAFTENLGSVDKSSDKILHVLDFFVKRAINTTEIQTDKKASELLNLHKDLTRGESTNDLYEVDENGITTGYLIRDINFGQFENDYNKFLNKLNKSISSKYGILLEVDNKQAPKQNEEARKEWLHEQNEWLDKHCERKYKKEYYEAFNQLSDYTRQARSDLYNQIQVIKNTCLEEDGFYHFDKLGEEDYNTLQQLYIQRKLLESDYNINGDLKEENSTQYKIAKELQALKEKTKSSKLSIKRNVEAWQKQRQQVIDKYGEDSKELRDWDLSNSKIVFKQDTDGNAILFKQIEKEAFDTINATEEERKSLNFGQEYNDLKEQLNGIINIYRDYNSGELLWENVPKALRKKISKIQYQMSKIKSEKVKTNARLQSLQRAKRELYKKYTKTEGTSTYKKMLTKAVESNSMDIFLASTHQFDPNFNDFTGPLLRQYSKLVAADEYYDEFMELVPGEGYTESDQNNENINKNFVGLEKYNKRWVPKKSINRYNNDKAFNKIKNSKTLSALYDSILDTMKESNKMYSGRFNHDDYLLPQISGSLYKRLKNQSGKWRHALDFVKEKIGIGSQSTLQDSEFGNSSVNPINQLDEFGNEILNNIIDDNVLLSGQRPDGRSLNLIPQYYVKKLDNPGQLSADLIGIVCEYYNKASLFNNKKQIQSKCEGLVDQLANRSVTKTAWTKRGLRKQTISGDKSRAFSMAKKYLEMNMYDKRAQVGSRTFTIGKHQVELNFGVFAKIVKGLGTAINLGMSPSVAMVGALSTMYSHIIQAITGQRYGIKEAFNAGMQVLYDLTTTSPAAMTGTILGTLLCNPLLGAPAGLLLGSIFDRVILRRGIIQNRLSNNLTVGMMEMFNIGNQLERKYKHTNRSKIINTINDNWCYGLLTFSDFIVKSQIMNSVLMSFRYYDGDFCTKEDLKLNFLNKPREEYKKALNEWKKGKSVFSIYEIKDGRPQIKPEYSNYTEAYNKVHDIIKNRILNYAESADGMMSETQKSAITANVVGAFVLMHRQYLPVMLQERYAKAQWDNSMQQMNGGVFRALTDFKMIRDLASATWCASIDMFTGQKNFGESFNERFYKDQQTPQDIIKRNYNLYKLKQIASELSTTIFILAPLISLFEAFIKDRDDDDDKLLQLLLYIQYRALWESKTPYLFSDLFNNFKTATAGTSVTDKVQDIFDNTIRTFFPRLGNSLLDTFFNENGQDNYDPTVRSGVYKNWSKVSRSWFKMLPFHNAFEQYYNSENKLRYFKNQIMKISD